MALQGTVRKVVAEDINFGTGVVLIPRADGTTTEATQVNASHIPTSDGRNVEQIIKGVGYSIDEFVDLTDAVAKIGSQEATLVIHKPITLSQDLTIPENICLKFLKGGKITVSSGYTLTVNGAIDAGLWQIFDGDGAVTGSPKIECVYPEWFGAKGDGINDDSQAIQKAIDFIESGSCIFTSTYKITSSIYVPYGVNLLGKGVKKTKIIAEGTGFNEFVFYLNTTDGITWTVAYPNLLSGKVEGIAFEGDGVNPIKFIVAAGSYEFVNLEFRKVAQSIKITGDYTDMVRLFRVYVTNTIGDDWQVYLTYLGDALIIEQCHFPSGYPISGVPRSIYVKGCFGGAIKNCIINTSIYLRDCHALKFENNHCEGATIEVYNSDIEIESCYMHLTQSEVITIINDSSILSRYKVVVRNVEFTWHADVDVSEYNPAIKLSSGIYLQLENVFTRVGRSGAIENNYLLGININKDDGTPFDEFNKYSYLYSKFCIIQNLQIIDSLSQVEAGSGIFYGLSYAGTYSSSRTWKEATGTYYYTFAIIYDPVRLIGKPSSSGEVSFPFTAGDGVIFYNPVEVGSRNPNTIIRFYRGTTSGSYDKYVDLPAINRPIVYDDGEVMCGFKWQTRTAGGVDGLNDYPYVEFRGENVIVRGTAPPTYGSWKAGDIVYNLTPAVDANNMILLGWICTADGTPGTWEPMYVSTVSPVV